MSRKDVPYINLYDRPTLEGHFLVSFDGMVLLAQIACFLLILVGSFYGYQLYSLNQVIAVKNMEFDNSSKKLLETAQKYPTQSLDKELDAKINQLMKERQDKVKLLSALAKNRIGKTKGFSKYMQALSNQWLDDIWLTNIRIESEKNGIELTGKTSRPDRVPEVLRRIGEEPVFEGITFDIFRINKSADSKFHSFTVKSNPEVMLDVSVNAKAH